MESTQGPPPRVAALSLPGRMAALMPEVAPETNKARRRSLPARLMRPIRCFPPVECSFGVSPIQAAR